MSASIYLSIPLMIGLAILQSVALPEFPILGIVPHLALVVVVAWALQHGLTEGLFWAFVAGFFLDLFSIAPLGTTSLAMMIAVVVIIFVQRNFPESRVIMPVLMVILATLVFWFVDLLLLRIIIPLIVNNLRFLGGALLNDRIRAPGLLDDIASFYSINRQSLSLILATAVAHSLLILPIYWAFYRLERLFRPRRVEI